MSKYSVEISKLESLMSEEVLLGLCESRAIVAGGTLTSLFSGKEVNDLDVYFRSPSSAIEFAKKMNSCGRVSFFHKTDRSILLKDWDAKQGGQDVQMIVYKFFQNPQQIFDAFDFTINMCAAEFSFDDDDEVKIEITMHDDFLKDVAQRRLVFNPGTDYPLVSDLRVEKYCAKGYSISKKEKFKILLAVNAKNINSWEVLKDELGSMYGLEKDSMFDETIEFSIPEAMGQLDNIVWRDSIYRLNHPSFRDVREVIAKNANVKLNNMEGRFFKVVKKISDGVYESIYRSGYKYILNQTAAENEHGIYVAMGDALSESCYWGKSWLYSNPGESNKNCVVIEIKFAEGTEVKFAPYSGAESMIGVGEYKVIKEYTASEWQDELNSPVVPSNLLQAGDVSVTIQSGKFHTGGFIQYGPDVSLFDNPFTVSIADIVKGV